MLQPVEGIELVINMKMVIDINEVLVVVSYITNCRIVTKGSIEKHKKQVSKIFDVVLENNMCGEIDKCHFDQMEVAFLGVIVDGKLIRMDPTNAQAMVNSPRPKNEQEDQQLLGLWNFD